MLVNTLTERAVWTRRKIFLYCPIHFCLFFNFFFSISICFISKCTNFEWGCRIMLERPKTNISGNSCWEQKRAQREYQLIFGGEKKQKAKCKLIIKTLIHAQTGADGMKHETGVKREDLPLPRRPQCELLSNKHPSAPSKCSFSVALI